MQGFSLIVHFLLCRYDTWWRHCDLTSNCRCNTSRLECTSWLKYMQVLSLIAMHFVCRYGSLKTAPFKVTSRDTWWRHCDGTFNCRCKSYWLEYMQGLSKYEKHLKFIQCQEVWILGRKIMFEKEKQRKHLTFRQHWKQRSDDFDVNFSNIAQVLIYQMPKYEHHSCTIQWDSVERKM